ncbi:MAG: hypothetical protein AB2796_18885 [Candidatus Thiodiazotropha sp.]
MKTRRRSRHSREEWQQLIQAHSESGLNENEFCAQRSISLTRFVHWKRRLDKATSDIADNTNWLELPTLPAATPSGWDIELDLGHGVCLRMSKH